MRNTILTHRVNIDQKTIIEVEYEGIDINPTLKKFLEDNHGAAKICCHWDEYYILTDHHNHWYLYNSNHPWWNAFLPLQLEIAAPYVAVQKVSWIGDYDWEGSGSGLRIFMEDENDEFVHDVIVY